MRGEKRWPHSSTPASERGRRPSPTSRRATQSSRSARPCSTPWTPTCPLRATCSPSTRRRTTRLDRLPRGHQGTRGQRHHRAARHHPRQDHPRVLRRGPLQQRGRVRRWGAVVIEGSKGDAACKGKTGRVASLAKSANAPPRSGATTSDRTSCRRASSPSPAPASPTTSSTRRSRSASRCSVARPEPHRHQSRVGSPARPFLFGRTPRKRHGDERALERPGEGAGGRHVRRLARSGLGEA